MQHRSGSLGEEEGGLGFGEEVSCVLVEEEVASLGILKDDVHGALLRDGVPEGNHMRVMGLGVQPNLTLHQFQLHLGRHCVQVDLGDLGRTTLTA